eukprot:TRINITY_DN16880_c0_g1_i1.p1 TRINITY_DN16880_c0_g1~~TRINITY_DN16880_c0_g1_i1.p1  ORF type:complete len:1575 (+),score=400.91 TRINITY_DN16880_c0_g1_i1:65-4726(+)
MRAPCAAALAVLPLVPLAAAVAPTVSPSVPPTASPNQPTASPSASPSVAPTGSPSRNPTTAPSVRPSDSPSTPPTLGPTGSPSLPPSQNPTVSPTAAPTTGPTVSPSPNPTVSPSVSPSQNPSVSPTPNPSVSPTTAPTRNPSVSPTQNPSVSPTRAPTACDGPGVQASRAAGTDEYAYNVTRAMGAVKFTDRLKEAGLDSALGSPAPPARYTVLASADAAWDKLPSGIAEQLKDPAVLTQLMQYHFLSSQQLTLGDLAASGTVYPALQGQTMRVTAAGSSTGVFRSLDGGSARVTQWDTCAWNGVIHIVDKILCPPDLLPTLNLARTAWETPGAKRFAEAITKVGLAFHLEAPGPLTVFAPSDAAVLRLEAGQWDALLQDASLMQKILRQHIVDARYETRASLLGSTPGTLTALSGETLSYSSLNGLDVQLASNGTTAQVVQTDVRATNGILHIIDQLLLPVNTTLPPASPPNVLSPAPSEPIAFIVAKSNATTQLAKLLSNSALPDPPYDFLAATNTGEYTLVAPTDAAWDRLPSGWKEFLNDDPQAMQRVLDALLLPGKTVTAASLPGGSPWVTRSGDHLTVEWVPSGAIVAGGTAVLDPVDVRAANGLIHAASAVPLPSGLALPPTDTLNTVTATQELSTLQRLIALAPAAQRALQGQGALTLFAPSDAAWARLPVGQLDALLAAPTATVEALLLSYVSAVYLARRDMRRAAGAVASLRPPHAIGFAPAAGGGVDVSFSQAPAAARANITEFDIRTRNGIVHVLGAAPLPADVAAALPTGSAPNLVLAGAKQPDLVTFSDLASRAGLSAGGAGDLGGPGPLTVFAPTDSAWGRLPKGVTELLRRRPAVLRGFLQGHTVQGRALAAAELIPHSPVQSAAGLPITFAAGKARPSDVVVMGTATVLRSAWASNGVLHVVSEVLPHGSVAGIPTLPLHQRVGREAGLSDFVGAVDAAGLSGLLTAEGPVTVLVPTNAALQRLGAAWLDIRADRLRLSQVLRYHVVSGYYAFADLLRTSPGLLLASAAGRMPRTLQARELRYDTTAGGSVVFNNGQAAIAQPNITATNGIAHTVDGLLYDPTDAQTAAAVQAALAGGSDVLAVARGRPELTQFAALAFAAGVAADLSGAGQRTVLAPTDAALAALPRGQLEMLRRRGDALSALLRYHVVPGFAIPAATLAVNSPLATLDGGSVTVSGTPAAGLLVNSAARVQSMDLYASNGVLHTVDAVLINRPSAWALSLPVRSLLEVVSQDGALGTLRRVIDTCGRACTELLQGAGPMTLFAPSDAALAGCGAPVADALRSSDAALQLLMRHTADRYLERGDVVPEPASVSVLSGATHTVQADSGGMRAAGAAVSRADILASNGVAHILSACLPAATGAYASGGDDDDFPVWVVVIAAVAGALCLCLLLGAAILLRQRRQDAAERRRRRSNSACSEVATPEQPLHRGVSWESLPPPGGPGNPIAAHFPPPAEQRAVSRDPEGSLKSPPVVFLEEDSPVRSPPPPGGGRAAVLSPSSAVVAPGGALAAERQTRLASMSAYSARRTRHSGALDL